LNYEFRPTWWLSLGYEYADRDYDVDVSDYTQDHISLSLRKQSKYNLYEASVGYADRQFDAREDEDIVTWMLAFTRQLGYDMYTRLALEQNFNQSGIAENFFRATQASLRFGKTFRGGRIPVTLNTFYREGDYRQDSILLPDGDIEDREDERYGIQASIGYNLFRWMTLLLTAGYENNDSNLERYEYDNTYVTLGVNTAFNIGGR
ncbi:MAG: surface lipoprotein assembly modifier, partial [Thermodesulfobacteriota bacterium]